MSYMSSSSRKGVHILIFDGGRNAVRGCYGSWAVLQWVTCAEPGRCRFPRKRCPVGEIHMYRYCPRSWRRLVERYTFDLPDLCTSNEAEWAAFCRGLSALQDHNVEGRVVLVGDSDLVLNQFAELWQVWADNLRPLRDEAWALRDMLDCDFEIEWRPRHVIAAYLGH